MAPTNTAETTTRRRERLTPKAVALFALDFTLLEIADRLDVSRQTVANWLDRAGVERPHQEHVPPGTSNEEKLSFGSGPQDPLTGCIPLRRQTNDRGYGQMKPNDERNQTGAHRIALEVKLGRRLVAGEVTRHHCVTHTPGCVNPEHLTVGSAADNIRDMHERRRGHTQQTYDSPEKVALRERAFALLSGGRSMRSVAAELGTSHGVVSSWVSRRDNEQKSE